MYFNAHDCLAAFMNILRINLIATCITSRTVAYDVTAVGPVSEETA